MGGHAKDIVAQYERHAARFDRERYKGLFEQTWLETMCSELGEAPSVLDLGCGSGEPIARYFSDAGAKVTGIDSSPSMIRQCRARFPEHTWLVADMRALDLGKSFDAIVAWDSFFHLTFTEQREMFPVFAAHLKVGGLLMYTSGHEHGEAIGTLCGEPLYHASLSTDEYRHLLHENGFEVVRHITEDPDCDLHTVWLARNT